MNKLTPIPVDPIMASPGFFKSRLVKNGPYVPCRLWKVEDRDELGELAGDVRFFAEIDGQPTDPFNPRNWPWHSITEAEFNYMTANAAWCRQHAPHDPAANPDRPMQLSQARIF